MRVSFYCARMDMRIARLALAAAEAGITLQLIVPVGTDINQLPLPCPYEDVVLYTDKQPLAQIVEKMTGFGAELVHAFASYNNNIHFLGLCNNDLFPVVGDAYDMLNTQYAGHTLDSTFLRLRDEEQRWLCRVDGLCLRSRYVKLLRQAGWYHSGKHVVFMPEPCEPKLATTRAKFSSRHSGVHILFMIDYTLAHGKGGYFIDILRASEKCGVYWHILEWPKLKVPDRLRAYFTKKFPNVFFHSYMQPAQYMELVSRVDIVTQSLDFYLHAAEGKYFYYNLAAAPYFFSNKINEAIECNSVFMIPEFFRAQAEYARKGRRGLGFAPTDLTDKNFWCTLEGRVAEILAEPQDFSRISTTRQGARLRRFYEKIIAGYAARTT